MNAPASAVALERPAFTPGVFEDMPAATYHALPALSSGGAKKLLRSPAHFRAYVDTPNDPTDAMLVGSAVHCGALEPDSFTGAVVRAPICDRRTKEGKATWSEFQAAAAGKIILSAADFDRALRCINAVADHPAAQALLHGARTEVSACWEDGEFGVACKARFDALSRGGVIDLKTCADASPEGFARALAQYDYPVQAAHYFSGAEHALDASPAFFAFICVESEAPHAVAVYELDRPTMLAGMRRVETALRRYRDCLKTGSFPGYPQQIQRINAPRWYLTFTE